MDGIAELAKMLKERENPSVQGIGIGNVLSISPLHVKFNGFDLSPSNVVVAAHLNAKKTTSSVSIGDHGTHTHEVDHTLKVGDSVIVAPSADNQKYYIIGKVG